MPFQNTLVLDPEREKFFGKYVTTFRSQNGQVEAHLFEQREWLVAHVWSPAGLEMEDVTDSYLRELTDYAAEHGFEGKLRIIHLEQAHH